MKKVLYLILLIIISILTFLFLPELFGWDKEQAFELTNEEITNAVILGIITPSLIPISRKIKSSLVFVLLAIVIIVTTIIVVKLLFPS
jgi:hypothetical protein